MISSPHSECDHIVVADTDGMVRDLFAAVCRLMFLGSVIVTTSSGTEALRLIKKLRPSLVLLETFLDNLEGYEVVVRGRVLDPNVRFVISTYCDEYTAHRLTTLPIDGLVDKRTDSVNTLQIALQAAREGRKYFSRRFIALQRALTTDNKSFPKVLSPTEQVVVALIGRGLDDTAIGTILRISARTAQTHRSNILRKLALPNTPQLMAFAIQRGFARWTPPTVGRIRIKSGGLRTAVGGRASDMHGVKAESGPPPLLSCR